MQFDSTTLRPTTHNRIGEVFGRLTVIGFAGYIKYGVYWLCQCSCPLGTIKPYFYGSLTSGRTRSCGCLNREAIIARQTTHGMTGTAEYNLWCHMIERCHNQQSKSYARYGGRGITLCERWRISFQNFYTDMGPRPTPQHTLERKDNNQGYSPENTIWATHYEQVRNTRRNVMLTYQGITLCLGDWAIRVGLKRHTLAARIRLGWPIDLALTIPSSYSNKLKSLMP